MSLGANQWKEDMTRLSWSNGNKSIQSELHCTRLLNRFKILGITITSFVKRLQNLLNPGTHSTKSSLV